MEYQKTESDSEAGRWIRNLFGLIFLSPEEVGDSFVEDFIAEEPKDVRIDKLIDYLVETCIDENANLGSK